VAAADRLDRPVRPQAAYEGARPGNGELADLDNEQLGAIAADGHRVAISLDEEGARLTVSVTDEREPAADAEAPASITGAGPPLAS
jgi:hypothetical protein